MREVPGIVLRPEQDDLLRQLIESERESPERHPFTVVRPDQSVNSLVLHPGRREDIEAYDGDLLELARFGLIAYWPDARSTPPGGNFDITQAGLNYYTMRLGDVNRD
jgi:hypothetical protein